MRARQPVGTRRIRKNKDKKPYVWVKIHAPGKEKQWEQEHRIIMEQKLGRLLAPGEVVHHKNEDSLDNRPENLELKTNAAHTADHNALHGRWAMKHDACLDCGRNDIPHVAHGLCRSCTSRKNYDKSIEGREKYSNAWDPAREAHPWSPKHKLDACIDCHSDQKPHLTGGRCASCYSKQRRRDNPALMQQYDHQKYLNRLAKHKP